MQTERVITSLFNIEIDENGEIMGNDQFDPEASGHLRPKLITANQRIQALQDSSANDRRQFFSKKSELEEYLKDNHQNMDTEHVREIAEIFDIELTKTIEFKATLIVKGEVEVPVWTEEPFEDVDFEVSLNYSTDGSVDSVEISEIEED